MKHPLAAYLAVVFAASMACAGAAAALTKDEVKAAKDKIEATYKADKKNCDAMKDNAKDICMAEAKGKQKVAKAELDASNKPGPRADEKVKQAKADAAHDVANEKCDDLKGNEKDVCKKDARAAQTKAIGEAKTARAEAEKGAKSAAAAGQRK